MSRSTCRHDEVLRKLLISAGLFCALILPVLPAGPLSQYSVRHAYADNDDAEQKAALEKVRRNIRKMQEDIRKTQVLHDSVQKEVRKLEMELARITKDLVKVQQRIRGEQAKLAKLYQQRKELKKDLQAQHKLLAAQIKSAYMMGRQEYVKIVLNLEESSVVARTMTYYDYFNRARLKRIEKSKNTLASLTTVEQKIKKQTVRLKDTREEYASKQDELRSVTHSRAQVVARLQSELVDKEQTLSQLLEDERRLERLLKDLDRAIPDILTDPGKRTPFARLKGKLLWPTKGKLQAVFGKRRNSSRARWNGVMIMAQAGKDVKAISYGRVAFADFLRGYGLLLIIDHGDGYMSLYAHNQAIYKDIGEWVEAGETISSVGTSGGQKDAGLYFEIRHNGKPTNPERWCRKG